MEDTQWGCYPNCRNSRTLRLGAATPVMPSSPSSKPAIGHPVTQPNALQSCLPKRPRSPGLLQSSHSRVYLPDFIPATARSFRWGSPGAAAHNIPRTHMGIYASFMWSYISHTQSSLFVTLVSQIITLHILYDDYVTHAYFYITLLSTSMWARQYSHLIMNGTVELESRTRTRVLGLKGRSREWFSRVLARTATDSAVEMRLGMS